MAGRFSIEAIFRLTDRMTRPIAKIQTRMQRMTRTARMGLRRMDRSFGRANRTIRRTAMVLGAVGLVAGAALGKIAQAGGGFEQAITNVGAVSLRTRAQIAPLEDLALRLGATTKFTATQAAGAMEIMARAGFKTSEILAGVPGILSAAAASGLEIAEVADHVSNALKGMGLAATEAGRVSDVLALASARTNSTIGTLGESLRNVAATASQLKIPFEDVVAGVALLQDVGLDASVAGSAMNTMLTKLAKPPAAIAKEMKRLKISFKDAQGNMLPFADVLGAISKASKASGGNLDQVAFLADLVGLRGQKAAANLSKLFESGKLQTLTEELDEAKGKAEEMAKLRMNTLHGDVTLLTSAFDGLQQKLFKLQGGPLRGVVQRTTEWLRANEALIVSGVEEFIEKVQQNLPTIVTWLERIGVALVVFYSLAAAVKVAQLALALYEGVVIAVTAAKWLFVKSVKAARIIMGLFAAQTKVAAGAQIELGFATKASSTAMGGMRGALNASKLGTAINGVTGKLGKAGLLGAALGVGVAIGTWLDHEFGISEMISGWLADVESLNSAIEFVGKLTGIKAIEDVGAGLRQRSEQREEIGFSTHRGTALPGSHPQPEIQSPQERLARTVTESMSTERQEHEITIRDESGRAEVTKAPSRSGGSARLTLQPSGAF